MVQLLAGIISLRRVLEANPGRSRGSADTLPLRHSARIKFRLMYLSTAQLCKNRMSFSLHMSLFQLSFRKDIEMYIRPLYLVVTVEKVQELTWCRPLFFKVLSLKCPSRSVPCLWGSRIPGQLQEHWWSSDWVEIVMPYMTSLFRRHCGRQM